MTRPYIRPVTGTRHPAVFLHEFRNFRCESKRDSIHSLSRMTVKDSSFATHPALAPISGPVLFATLFVLAVSQPFWATCAEEDNGKVAEWIVTPGAPVVIKSVSAFNGSTLRLRWIVREAGDGPFRVEADTFQILTNTLAPIESQIELGKNLTTQSGRPVEATKDIVLPDADKPVRYLVKLWLVRGGKRQALSIVAVAGVPPTIFAPLKGSTVSVAGFETLPDWIGFLKKSKISVTMITLPDEASMKGAWDGALIAKWPNDRPIPASHLLTPNQRLLALTPADHFFDPDYTVFPSGNGGLVTALSIDGLQDFATSPDMQFRVMRFLMYRPDNSISVIEPQP